MSNEIANDRTKIFPIQIEQSEEPTLYKSLRKWGCIPRWTWFLATKDVLEMMTKIDLLSNQKKQTVWHFWKRYGQDVSDRSFHEKIGTGFSDISFANECFISSKQKAQMIINSNLTSSYQFHDFSDNHSGVSTRFIFKIISLTGKTRIINCVNGIAGLNGWENLALGLGLNYRLGLIKPYDKQFQDILKIADETVANKSADFRPKGTSINQYVRNLFYLINRELPLRIK